MQEAKTITNAERCSLFLIDDNGELVSKVFDGNDVRKCVSNYLLVKSLYMFFPIELGGDQN